MTEIALSEFDEDYLEQLRYLCRSFIPIQFINCSAFRVSLYILRERLLPFIEGRFREYLQGLPDWRKSSIKKAIKDNLRTTDPAGNALEYSEKNKDRIDALYVSEFTPEWCTFARCYTVNFLKSDYPKIEQYRAYSADPKDLLEILKNCSLFGDQIYILACRVIQSRNKYYSHTSHLLIYSDVLEDLIFCINTLKNYLQ